MDAEGWAEFDTVYRRGVRISLERYEAMTAGLLQALTSDNVNLRAHTSTTSADDLEQAIQHFLDLFEACLAERPEHRRATA